jgi:adenylate kinase family enzyme
MQRIMIIGSSGSGKSTLGKLLQEKTNVPLIHLDKHYWKPNWVEPSKEEWEVIQKPLVEGDKWIMDGNYSGTFHIRIPRADTIIFLNRSCWICLYRVLRRRLKYHKMTRPDMTNDCNERINWQFLMYVFHYPLSRRPRVLKQLAAVQSEKNIIILQSDAEIKIFLDRMDEI